MKRILFIGPMLGSRDGWVKNQAQIQGAKFADEGHTVSYSSSRPGRIPRMLDILWTLVRERKRTDVVVFSIFGYRASFLLNDIESMAARALGYRSVAVVHSGDFPEFALKHPRWVRRVLRRATILAAPSPFLVRELAKIGFTSIEIPNIVDLVGVEKPHVRSSFQPKLLWMRKFHELYNPEMAIRVLHQLRTSGVDATLTMAGQTIGIDSRSSTTNTLLDQTQALAAQLGVSDHVTFPGFLDGDQKRKAFADHDFFINTNHVDNAPVGLLEAASAGLAIVTTDVGGIRDIVTDGVEALLVSDNDHVAMAEAVLRLVNEPETAIRLCRAATERAAAFTWPRVSEVWKAVFSQLDSNTVSP